jgi:hypothetical protein
MMQFIATPTNAASPKTLVIVDTGVDMSIPSIKAAVVYEVCFTMNKTCPNGQLSMEGPGAANVTPAMATNKSWEHGTKVISAAIQTDPNVKIIEIRCAQLVGTNGFINCTYDMVANAFNWIYTNKDKYNIGAVVSPLGKNLPIGGKTEVPCDTTASYVPAINKVISTGIAVMFPTGNDYNYANVSSPSCLPGVIAISSIDDKGRLALYANYSSRVDFAALGNLNVLVPGGATKSDFGTSLSVAVFGAYWLQLLNLKNMDFQSEYNLIKNTGDNYTNIMVKKNVIGINASKALTGLTNL